MIDFWGRLAAPRRGRRIDKDERKRKRALSKATAKLAVTIRDQTSCSSRTGGCSAAHAGTRQLQPCIVCSVPTQARQTVSAWDVPCCTDKADHNLFRDFRVVFTIRWGKPTLARAERRIELAR